MTSARLAAIFLLSVAITAAALVATSYVERPAVTTCGDASCEELREHHSYGWPVPWRTDAPPSELEGVTTQFPFGLGGMNSSGVSPPSLAANMVLWFAASFGGLLVLHALLSKTWRVLNPPFRLANGLGIAVGMAAAATILSTLVTTAGTWNGVPYESAGWPIEWSTSPWLHSSYDAEGPAAYEAFRAALRPYNMLGYSPIWLFANFAFWVVAALAVEASIITVGVVTTKARRGAHLLSAAERPH